MGEIGEEFEGVADIDEDDEGWGRLGGGEIAGVALGLRAGFEHGAAVEIGAGRAGPIGGGKIEGELAFGGGRGGLVFGAGVDRGLFRFEDETAAAVEVDLADGDAAIGVVERDGAFEDVGVFSAVGAGGIGVRESEQVAELGEEEILVGTLRALGVGPAGDKSGDGIVGHAEVRESGVRNRAKARGLAKGKCRELQYRPTASEPVWIRLGYR